MFILDAGTGIENNPNWYSPAQAKSGIFIKSAKNPDKYDGNLIGAVWPGAAAFPDFVNPATSDYWSQGLEVLYS